MPPFHCKSYYSSGQDQLLDPSQARYCNYKLDSQGLLLSPAAPAASPYLLSAQASLAQDESILSHLSRADCRVLQENGGEQAQN